MCCVYVYVFASINYKIKKHYVIKGVNKKKGGEFFVFCFISENRYNESKFIVQKKKDY